MYDCELETLNREAKINPAGLVRRSEKNYRQKLEDIKNDVLSHGGVRLFLLSGPSASGKTTTAAILSDAFRRAGVASEVISLDNFYRESDDPDYPKLPDGTRDLESDEALHLPMLHACLEKVTAGEPFEVPRYDFGAGSRVGTANRFPSMKDGIVMIEGLHALNPKITDGLPAERCRKMFISLSTNLTEDGRRILSGRKLRFVRRTVRDRLYRDASAAHTFALWENVLAGEDKYLYPYRDRADYTMNTFHPFEVGLMAPLFLKTLSEHPVEHPYVRTVTAALEKVVPVPESLVPLDSLLREFIPGGIYESMY